MNILDLLLYLFVLVYLGGMIFVANRLQAEPVNADVNTPPLNAMLYGMCLLIFLYGFLVMQTAMLTTAERVEAAIPAVDVTAALFGFALSGGAAALSFALVRSAALRVGLRRLLPPLASYNPDAPVHTTAIVLSLALLTFTINQLILSGGVEGLAQSLVEQGIDVSSVVLQNLILVMVSLLGIGLFIRRGQPQAIGRLGLRMPTRDDVTMGIGIGVALYVMIVLLQTVWLVIVSPEQFAEQNAAAEQLARALDTLPVLLVVSITVPIGEELFFRGALQPVFGIGLTSVLFTILHTQYGLTPATLGIFVVSVGLGWLRLRFSTTASIIAHFAYNFVQLAPLLVLALRGGG